MEDWSFCNRCYISVILAIIFGALFLWSFVNGFKLQFTTDANFWIVFIWYVLALIWLSMAKIFKKNFYLCSCRLRMFPNDTPPKKKATAKKR